MLSVDHIDAYYGDFQVLWGVSLVVKEREVVSLVGANGAGKSTVLKSISGMLKPRRGKIEFQNARLDQKRAHKIVEMGICMVPEGKRLFPDMSVLENLEIGAYLSRARRVREKTLDWVYDIFPRLKERTGQPARTLSGGEQQMLAIGRALMSLPKILLLDEITLGLSPLIVENIFEVIKQINESSGIAILLVEQNVVLALELAETGYIIENGRIVGKDNAKVLLEDERVKDAFLGLPSGSGEVR
ncbi:MAG: ABC transporter ATP-binding protein [Desulfobacteraceae bacterium]|nr:MAG: ABC transporter ATP-binding protein [Desulfobacteraceae bacterium]